MTVADSHAPGRQQRRARVQFSLTPQAAALLDELVATGLYGFSRNDVALGMFRAGLREVAAARHQKPPVRDV